jgi:hypothetical protein|tara:strand:- start:5301 stop:5507 length:207 start_codon:yes stop_codon:yes gene_type:complete
MSEAREALESIVNDFGDGRTPEEVLDTDDRQLQESTCEDCLSQFVNKLNIDSIKEHSKCLECAIKAFK